MKRWYENRFVAIVWAALRIWLGVQWLEAGWHKLGAFDAGGFLQGAIAKAGGEFPAVQGWYADFLQNVALPNVKIINVLIPMGEILVGLGLIVGALTLPALVAGAFMNLNFLLAGTISTNPILLALAVILLFVIKGTKFYGIDHFLTKETYTKFKNTNFFKKIRGAAAH